MPNLKSTLWCSNVTRLTLSTLSTQYLFLNCLQHGLIGPFWHTTCLRGCVLHSPPASHYKQTPNDFYSIKWKGKDIIKKFRQLIFLYYFFDIFVRGVYYFFKKMSPACMQKYQKVIFLQYFLIFLNVGLFLKKIMDSTYKNIKKQYRNITSQKLTLKTTPYEFLKL